MNMDKEQLSRLILDQAIEGTKNNYPKSFENYWGIPTEYAYRALGMDLRNNGMASDAPDDVTEERRNVAKASAFTISVVTGLYMTDALRDNIDKFFNDSKNDPYFEGYSDEQKNALRAQLKDSVKEQLAVKAKTERGIELVNNLTSKFDEVFKYKDDETERQQHNAQNIYLDEYGQKTFQSTISMLARLNQNMVINKSAQQAVDSAKDFASLSSDFEMLIADAIATDSEQLAMEEEGVMRGRRLFSLDDLDGKKSIDVQKFLNHYNSPKGLTDEEKKWALAAFDKYIKIDYNDFRYFMANGKPMFKPEELTEDAKLDRKIDVIANSLMTKEVTHKKDNKELFICEIDSDFSKSLWEKICEFFKDLLGINKEKQRAETISNMRGDYSKKQGERTNFNELSGFNALNKLTVPPERPNEHTAEKKEPTIEK